MVLSFPGFFTRLNIPIPSPVLQAAMLPHCYRLNQPVLMHTIHSLPLSSHSLFSSSLSSPPAIWIYFSVFPGLAPGLRGFSDHSYFWEAFQAGGRKSRQRWTVPCHLNWTPVTWAFPSPSPLKATLGRLRGWRTEERGVLPWLGRRVSLSRPRWSRLCDKADIFVTFFTRILPLFLPPQTLSSSIS